MSPPAWQMKRFWKFYDFTLVLIYSKWASRLSLQITGWIWKTFQKDEMHHLTPVFKPKHFRFLKGFPCHTKKNNVCKGKITWRYRHLRMRSLSKRIAQPTQKWQFCHLLLIIMLFQFCMGFFLLLNIQKIFWGMFLTGLCQTEQEVYPTQAVWRLLGEVS